MPTDGILSSGLSLDLTYSTHYAGGRGGPPGRGGRGGGRGGPPGRGGRGGGRGGKPGIKGGAKVVIVRH